MEALWKTYGKCYGMGIELKEQYLYTLQFAND